MKHTDLTVGGTLPNGATILAWAVLAEDDMIILANLRGDFVTWIANPADLRTTCHGHYFGSDRAAAVVAFGERIESRLCYIRDNCTSYHTEGESPVGV